MDRAGKTNKQTKMIIHTLRISWLTAPVQFTSVKSWINNFRCPTSRAPAEEVCPAHRSRSWEAIGRGCILSPCSDSCSRPAPERCPIPDSSYQREPKKAHLDPPTITALFIASCFPASTLCFSHPSGRWGSLYPQNPDHGPPLLGRKHRGAWPSWPQWRECCHGSHCSSASAAGRK